MFLKFLGKDQSCKLRISDNVKTLPEFKAEIGKFVKVGEEPLEISFVDVEEDVVEIKDDIDLEYMLELAKEQNQLMINVTKSNKTEVLVLEEKQESELEPQQAPKLEVQEEPANEQLVCSINEQSIKDQLTVVYKESNALHENQGDQTQFKLDDSINLKGTEPSLDLSVIKMAEAPKFETIDTKYDFTKHKAVGTVLEYIEDFGIEPQEAPKEPQITRESLEESFASSNSFLELKCKLDLVTEIARQGFSNLNAEIQNLSVLNELNNSSLPQPQSNNQTSHLTIRCDNCNVFPLVGNRYKCLICPNFDLCSTCEAKNIHKHPMLIFYDNCKIPNVEQMTTIFRTKQNLQSMTDQDIKIRILKNIAGDKYPEVFYHEYVEKRRNKSINDFTDDVMRIFG